MDLRRPPSRLQPKRDTGKCKVQTISARARRTELNGSCHSAPITTISGNQLGIGDDLNQFTLVFGCHGEVANSKQYDHAVKNTLGLHSENQASSSRIQDDGNSFSIKCIDFWNLSKTVSWTIPQGENFHPNGGCGTSLAIQDDNCSEYGTKMPEVMLPDLGGISGRCDQQLHRDIEIDEILTNTEHHSNKKKRKRKSANKRWSASKVSKTRKHPTPCYCVGICRKDCPCVLNQVSCEKSCGCSDECENLYHGCTCAYGKCRRDGCPCYDAHRECDPEVCKGCWNSCETEQRGEGKCPCDNMNILQGRSQEVKKGKSLIVESESGAFLINSVKKDTYIGEYTGKLISHDEADELQKEYPDSSYMFELDDEYLVDARDDENNILKYANHSARPNCYAMVLFVGDRYRIGFFSKHKIKAGEELFIDYGPRYRLIWKNTKKQERPIEKAVETISKRRGRPKKTVETVFKRRGQPKKQATQGMDYT